MRCPKCKLENPPTAQRCDCGYDFASGQMKESYLTKSGPKRGLKAGSRKPSGWLMGAGWIFSFLGGLIGFFIAYEIAYRKDKADPSRRTYAYDEASRSRGKVMLGFAIVMMFVSAAVRLASVVPHPPR